MRNVLSSVSECIHFWANQVQPSGRAASVFFEDARVYSYGRHFCMARILPGGAVAITTRSYSITTTGHLSHVRAAVRPRALVFCNDPADDARANMEHARRTIRDALTAAEKKGIRQITRDRFNGEALHAAERANAYLAALLEDEQQGQRAIDTSSLEGVRAALIAAEEAQKRIQEESRIARRRDLEDSLTIWRAAAGYVRTGLYELPPALRLSEDGSVVQSSHGAEIPAADALKLWPMVLHVMRGEKDYTPGAPIGAYRLTRIRQDGSIVVGCHDIAFKEIEGIAEKLGLIEPAIAS